MKQRGFTLIELMIVVAIIGILAAIAVPQYQSYIARSQAAESLTLFNGGKTLIQDNLQAGQCSSTTAAENTVNGKYGVLTINAGAASSSTVDTDSSGCTMLYTFRATSAGVSPKIAGTTLTVTVLNNGSLVRGAPTTLGNAFIPKAIATAASS